MTFSYAEGKTPDQVHLHVNQSLEVLAKIAGFLRAREAEYRDGSIELGVVAGPFQWQGYTLGEWMGDLKTKAAVLQINQKRDRLEQLEKWLDAVISPELRRQMELEAIQRELAS